MKETVTIPDGYDFLGDLYDAVMAPSGFQVFTEKLADALNLKAVAVIVCHLQTQEVKQLWLAGVSEQWMARYAVEYAADDILTRHIQQAPIARFYASNLDVTEPENFTQTAFYREWLQPQGIAFAAGAVILQEGPWVTQLLLQRRADQPPFSREEMHFLNQVTPHLQRAIQMRQRLEVLQLNQQMLACGLDMLSLPTFLIGEHGLVTYCNTSARQILERDTVLRLHNGHLQTHDNKLTRQLGFELSKSVAASRTEGGEFSSTLQLARNGQAPLMLMMLPLRLSAEPRSHGAALMFAFDPDAAPCLTIDNVQRLFRLSVTEAKLAIALCSGQTLEEFACERGTSIHTVKSQLKSIYLKTGSNRQTQLVAMLLASPAFFIAGKTAGMLQDDV